MTGFYISEGKLYKYHSRNQLIKSFHGIKPAQALDLFHVLLTTGSCCWMQLTSKATARFAIANSNSGRTIMNDILEVAADLSINHLHGSNGVTEKIKKAMYESAKQFVYIGFLLKEVKDYKYYEEGGYENVYTYAEFELGFKRSSTKNFIAIAETFGIQEWKYQAIAHKSQSMSLQPAYEKFNYSQLVELLAMSPAQRQAAKPEMTVRDLRSIKQKDRKEAIRNEPLPASMQQTAGQTSGYAVRWIPYNGRSPQKGKWPCKLVVHIVYLDGKPRENIDFAFYRNGKWENRQGKEIIDVKHYSEIPDLPGRFPPLG